MSYNKKDICIDCGKEYVRRSSTQRRCKECQEVHRKELHHNRYLEAKEKRSKIRAAKYIKGAVYIDGHPQICKYASKCFYGSKGHSDCSYCIETGHSRISQGLFIKDGKCDAYTPKGKRKMKRVEPVSYCPADNAHIWLEV